MNEIVSMKVKLLNEKAKMPRYAHEGDSGMDLFSLEEYRIKPGESAKVKTGIAIELPVGCEGQIRGRSSSGLNYPLIVYMGTIDNGYRGEICVVCRNVSHNDELVIAKGQRIAQLVIAPVMRVKQLIQVDELSETERGESGFGSTGCM